MSRSLQSSIEYFGGSKRWSRNDRDMVPWKSSIGLISSKISSRPEAVGHVVAAALRGLLDPGLPDLVAEQGVEAVGLECQEVRDLERLADLRERDAAGGDAGGAVLGGAVVGLAGGARGGQEGSFRGLPDSLYARMPDDPGQRPWVRSGGSAKRQHTRWPGSLQRPPSAVSGREPPPQDPCGQPLRLSQPEQDGPPRAQRQGSPGIPGVSAARSRGRWPARAAGRTTRGYAQVRGR